MRYLLKILHGQALFAVLAVLTMFFASAAQCAEITNITPTRQSVSLSGEWKFKKDSAEEEKGLVEKWHLSSYDDSNWEKIEIPEKLKFRKIKKTRWYRKNFIIPSSFKNKTIILRFMSANITARVWLNGHFLGEHWHGAVPFQFEISKYIKHNSPNLVAVQLKMTPRSEGNAYWLSAGIESEVTCIALPEIHIGKVLVDTSYPAWFRARLNIQSADINNSRNFLSYEIREHKTGKLIKKDDVDELKINQGINKHSFETSIKNALPWAPECPNLYDIFIHIKDAKGKVVDTWKDTIGFRKFEAKGKNLYLNGKIFHPFYQGPGVGTGYDGKERTVSAERAGPNGTYPVWTSKKRFDFYRSMGINLIRSLSAVTLRPCYGRIMDEIGMLHELEPCWLERGKIINKRKDITGGKERAYSPETIAFFKELVEYYYNRPSTVMYSTGNETWNVPSKDHYVVPLLNELYDAAREIDPYRPITNSEGAYDCDSLHTAALFKHLNELRSDINTAHDYHGWYQGPIQSIALRSSNFYSLSKKPFMLTEVVGCYARPRTVAALIRRGRGAYVDQWSRFVGDWNDKKGQILYAARNNKEILEYQRMHPDIFAAVCHHHNMYTFPTQKVLKRVLSPIFTCLDIDARGKNYFLGDNISVTLYALNDYLYKSVKNAALTVELVDSSGKKLFQWDENVSLPSTSFRKMPLEVKIPKNIPTGDYSINLFLKNGDNLLNDNSYNIFVMSRKNIPSSIQTDKKVLLFEKNEDNELSAILKELSIKHTKWDIQTAENNPGQLKDYDVLIIGPDAMGDGDFFFENGAAFKKFVSEGGRLLCLEQHSGIFMGWIPVDLFLKGNSTRRSSDFSASRCWFNCINIKDFSHPVFNGLTSWKRFDTWNGDYGIISDVWLSGDDKQMKNNILGSAGIRGSVILNLKHGKGEYLLSQLYAVNRWEKDPVATKYIVNLLSYIINGTSAAKASHKVEKNIIENGPFAPDEKGFIRQWLICGPFPNPGGEKQTGFNTDHLFRKQGGFLIGGETKIEPTPGMQEEAMFLKEIDGHNWWKLPKDKKLELIWEKYASKGKYFNLLGPAGYFKNSSLAYAACYVESSEDKEAKVKIGHNDGYKLWINHKYAGGNKECYAKPDSVVHKIKLKKGSNLVLLKISNFYGGFGFYLRFTDLDDKPLTDLKIWLIPNIGKINF